MYLQTIWNEIPLEIVDLLYLNITQDVMLWNTSRTREMDHPVTWEESKRIQEDQSRETMTKDTFCRMRPDGIAVLPPVGNKAGIFCILEYNRMSDVTDQYLLRFKSTSENQYESLRSALSEAIHRQGWKVEQISFTTGSRSVNEQDLRNNLKFFRVPEGSIQFVYSKVTRRVFDVSP
jgi:hypothetical protein